MVYLPAWLILALVIAAVYGAVFHLLWGQSFPGLLRVLLIAIAGFLIGEIGARLTGLAIFMVGDVHAGVASVTAWAGLAIARWLFHEP